VLDVGCGHGGHALEIAPACRSVVAFDRIASWIARAEKEQRARGVVNATFLCHDSSPAANEAAPPGATFARIFREHAVQGSIWLPHGRTIWRAVVR